MAMKYDINIIVKKNIADYNKQQKKLFLNLKKQYPLNINEIEYDFKRKLDTNLIEFINNESQTSRALKILSDNKYVKKTLIDIANLFFIRKSDLEKYVESVLFNELFIQKENNKKLNDFILEKIKIDMIRSEDKFKYMRNSLEKNISLYAPFILNGGFNQNFTLLDIGVNSSNQGDGAEHIFVAKAMIAGFNSSIVDVGSSGYDAVIENKNGRLLKVQVKSFTVDNFSRKGRDRGGEGIDSSNRSNKGKLVSSLNCDIFVAVNKKNAELFIFSKNEIDLLPETNIKRIDFMSNWENWTKINS